MTQEKCDICASLNELQQTAEGKICLHCRTLIAQIAEHPKILNTLEEAAKIQRTAAPVDIPDVLNGVRYRTDDRDNNTWYVSVSELQGRPVEIFASSAFENEQQLQSKLSNLTSITRLTSLILRHIFAQETLSLQKVVVQLQRSSRQPNDIPEILARILANYEKSEEQSEQEEEILP